MMATQFSHNSFLYFKYIIRKGNGTFVSSAYLKLQSFFILIPGSPKLPGPPKTFSFILYTYHSQNQRAKRTAKPFRPLILFFILFYFVLFSVFLPSVVFFLPHKAPKNAVDITKANTRLTFSAHLHSRQSDPPQAVRPQIQPSAAIRRRWPVPGKNPADPRTG